MERGRGGGGGIVERVGVLEGVRGLSREYVGERHVAGLVLDYALQLLIGVVCV
jgi:hypothetical protein